MVRGGQSKVAICLETVQCHSDMIAWKTIGRYVGSFGLEIESGSFFIPIASDGTVAQPICRMRPMTGAADLAYDDKSHASLVLAQHGFRAVTPSFAKEFST